MEIETKKGEKILVSECDYEHLKQFKWYIRKDIYATASINKKMYLIHRYIMIELYGNKELTRHNFIDHINGNKLDNRRENLRIVTQAENNMNKNKAKNASSKYFGVNYNKKNFRVSIKLNDVNQYIRAYYKIEEHAAYQYDLWVSQYNIIHAKKNNIKKPDNFIEYKKKEKDGVNIPKGISFKKCNNTYVIKYKSIHYGVYKTLEEALDKLKKIKQEVEFKRIEEINNTPIKRNEKGECIIELFNKKKEKVGETIVDEENYYDLMKYNWYSNGNYVSALINKKAILLHRYIMNYTGNNYIDHINNNSLDNRICNLRIVTPQQNSMNCSSSKNSTSKYIGVLLYKNRNKWVAKISINGKEVFLGYFENEIDAAKARDLATKEHFGEFGNLNFHDEIN